MRFLLGLAFGFMIGFPYGVFETVEISDSAVVKSIAFFKGIMEAIGK